MTLKKPTAITFAPDCTPSTLEYLINRTSLFFLDYFCQLFQHISETSTRITTSNNKKQGKKQGKKKRNNSKYKLTILNEEVDVMCLPTGYYWSFSFT